MINDIKIRVGRTEDLPQVYHLVRELAEYEKAPEAVTATLEDYYRDHEAGIFECLVAEMEGQVVGMAIYYMSYSTWRGRMLYLEDFVVAQSHRRYGIGQLLFDAFLEQAKAKGAVMVKWQVLDWNEPAVNFYVKNQAIIEKEWWNGKIIFVRE